jgi:hypothetical protein
MFTRAQPLTTVLSHLNPFHTPYPPDSFKIIFLNWYSGGGGFQLGPLGTAATNRPIASAPGDYDDGEIG